MSGLFFAATTRRSITEGIREQQHEGEKTTKRARMLSASEAGIQASPLDHNSKKGAGRPARADRPQCRQADLKGMDARGLKAWGLDMVSGTQISIGSF